MRFVRNMNSSLSHLLTIYKSVKALAFFLTWLQLYWDQLNKELMHKLVPTETQFLQSTGQCISLLKMNPFAGFLVHSVPFSLLNTDLQYIQYIHRFVLCILFCQQIEQYYQLAVCLRKFLCRIFSIITEKINL